MDLLLEPGLTNALTQVLDDCRVVHADEGPDRVQRECGPDLTNPPQYGHSVLRTVEYKLWIDDQGQPERLHHIPSDPAEETNLQHTAEGKAKEALDLLTKAAAEFPSTDAHPRYDPLPAQPWDKPPLPEKDNTQSR